MVNDAIFIGLVTHRSSRFANATLESGLAHSLARELRLLGVRVFLAINAEDAYRPGTAPLTKRAVLASIAAELEIEFRWRQFLNPAVTDSAIRRWLLRMQLSVRRIYRIAKLAPPWRKRLLVTDPGPQSLRRLINIELSHVKLLQKAVDHSATWTLILEDDAACEDVASLAAGLLTLMRCGRAGQQPKFVNLSRSFAIADLIPPTELVSLFESDCGEVLSSRLPFTNTVCAILYRTSFGNQVLEKISQNSIEPVIPIDWKLNAVLMDLTEHGDFGAGDCWTVEPGPIIQRSIHAQNTALQDRSMHT